VTIPQIFARAGGPAATSAHEARYNLVQTLDLVRVYGNCNTIGNLAISIRLFSRLKVAAHNLSGATNLNSTI
jgi:hypothetical protein